jgi:hypothetical protein
MKRVGGKVREGESQKVWVGEPVGNLSQDATCQTTGTAPGEVSASKEMTDEQMQNARKHMEENLREDTQQNIERELVTSLLEVRTGLTCRRR